MKLLKSFYYALSGLFYNIIEERNFRIHIIAVLSVVWFSIVYGVTTSEKVFLTVLCGMVMFLELINTSIEKVIDGFCDVKNEYAKIAKDSSAAAVLVLAICAVFCAFFIFSDAEKWKNIIIPYITKHWILIIIFMIISWFFIFKINRHQKTDKEK